MVVTPEKIAPDDLLTLGRTKKSNKKAGRQGLCGPNPLRLVSARGALPWWQKSPA
jgi:hypothetical protein